MRSSPDTPAGSVSPGGDRYRHVEDRRFRPRERGFTLVELLVVIVILGVLSGVVVFAVSNLTQKSQSAACAADERSITDAEEAYNARVGGYVSEAQLVSQGYLRQESALHDVTLTSGSYEVTPVASCLTGDELASASGAPGAAFSVRLLDSGGAGLEGATIEYSDGAWSTLGETGPDGVAPGNLAPGTYDLQIDYRGQTQALPATVIGAGSVIDFHTVPMTVAVAGAPGAAVAHLGNDGYWMSDEDTDAKGAAQLELLEGSYAFRVDYSGTTQLVSGIPAAKQPLVAFDLVTVTVKVGQSGVAVAHRGNNGVWIEDGTTDGSGLVAVRVLPGDYDFRGQIKGQDLRSSGSILGDSVVGLS